MNCQSFEFTTWRLQALIKPYQIQHTLNARWGVFPVFSNHAKGLNLVSNALWPTLHRFHIHYLQGVPAPWLCEFLVGVGTALDRHRAYLSHYTVARMLRPITTLLHCLDALLMTCCLAAKAVAHTVRQDREAEAQRRAMHAKRHHTPCLQQFKYSSSSTDPTGETTCLLHGCI
jgi:hypothetical protein